MVNIPPHNDVSSRQWRRSKLGTDVFEPSPPTLSGNMKPFPTLTESGSESGFGPASTSFTSSSAAAAPAYSQTHDPILLSSQQIAFVGFVFLVILAFIFGFTLYVRRRVHDEDDERQVMARADGWDASDLERGGRTTVFSSSLFPTVQFSRRVYTATFLIPKASKKHYQPQQQQHEHEHEERSQHQCGRKQTVSSSPASGLTEEIELRDMCAQGPLQFSFTVMTPLYGHAAHGTYDISRRRSGGNRMTRSSLLSSRGYLHSPTVTPSSSSSSSSLSHGVDRTFVGSIVDDFLLMEAEMPTRQDDFFPSRTATVAAIGTAIGTDIVTSTESSPPLTVAQDSPHAPLTSVYKQIKQRSRQYGHHKFLLAVDQFIPRQPYSTNVTCHACVLKSKKGGSTRRLQQNLSGNEKKRNQSCQQTQTETKMKSGEEDGFASADLYAAFEVGVGASGSRVGAALTEYYPCNVTARASSASLVSRVSTESANSVLSTSSSLTPTCIAVSATTPFLSDRYSFSPNGSIAVNNHNDTIIEQEEEEEDEDEEDEEEKERNECSICIEPFRKSAMVRKLPCLHTFHVVCFDDFLKSNMRDGVTICCPMCRTPLVRIDEDADIL